jgi:hypothetical protein
MEKPSPGKTYLRKMSSDDEDMTTSGSGSEAEDEFEEPVMKGKGKAAVPKPKAKQLLEDSGSEGEDGDAASDASDDDDGSDDDGSGDADSSDSDLPIEKKSKKLDKDAARRKVEAEQELQVCACEGRGLWRRPDGAGFCAALCYESPAWLGGNCSRCRLGVRGRGWPPVAMCTAALCVLNRGGRSCEPHVAPRWPSFVAPEGGCGPRSRVFPHFVAQRPSHDPETSSRRAALCATQHAAVLSCWGASLWLRVHATQHCTGRGCLPDCAPSCPRPPPMRARARLPPPPPPPPPTPLQRAIADSEMFQLPSREQLAEESRAPPEQAVIHRRISDVVGVLMDFNKRREPGVQRAAYINQLTADVCNYYGYNQDLVRGSGWRCAALGAVALTDGRCGCSFSSV